MAPKSTIQVDDDPTININSKSRAIPEEDLAKNSEQSFF
jgi:hypothetical protein